MGPQHNNMNMLNEFEGITITTFKGLVEMQSRSLFSSQIWKEKYLIVEDGYMYFLKDIKHSVDESTTLKVEMEPNSGIYPEENLDQKAKFFIRFTSSKHDISLAFSDHAVRDNLLICLMTLMTQQFVNGAKVIPKRSSFYRKVIEKGFNRLTPTSNSFKSKQKNEKGATERVSLSKDKDAYRKKSTGMDNMANQLRQSGFATMTYQSNANNDVVDGGSTEQPYDKKLSNSLNDECGPFKNDIKVTTEVKPVNDIRKLKIDKIPDKQIKKEKANITTEEVKDVNSNKSQNSNRISKPRQTPFSKKQRGPLSRSESCNTYVTLTQTSDAEESHEKILSTNSKISLKNSDKKEKPKSKGSNLSVGFQKSKQSLQSKKTIMPLKRSESANTVLESRKIDTKVSNFNGTGKLKKTSVTEEIPEEVLINNSKASLQNNRKKEDSKRKDLTDSIGGQISKQTIQPKRTFTPLTRTKSTNTVLESKMNSTKGSKGYGNKNISKSSISKESHSDLDDKKETLETREKAIVKKSKPIEKDPNHLAGFQRSKLSIRSKKTPAPLARSDSANIVLESKKDSSKLRNGYRTKNLNRTTISGTNDEKALVNNIKATLEKADRKEDLGRKDTGHSVGYQKSEQSLPTNRKTTPLKRSELPNTIIESKKNSTNISNGYGTRKERPSFKANNASRQPQEQYVSTSSKQTELNRVPLSKTRSAQLKKPVAPLKKTESVKTFQTSSRSNVTLETKIQRSVVTFV